MSTAPYQAQAAQLITGSLEHHVQVTAVPAAGDPFVVPIEGNDLTVTFDDSWSPHIQARLTSTVPLSAAQLDALDGRAGCRLRIDAGYIYPDRSADIHQLGDLLLTDRRVRRPANTMALEAMSDEIKAHNDVAWTDGSLYAKGGINEAITYLANVAMSPDNATLVSTFGAGARTDLMAGYLPEMGDGIWDLMADLAAGADAWLYVDSAGQWRLRPRVHNAGTPVHTMATGPGGTITTSEAALGIAGWYNAVYLRYRWKNGEAEQDIKARARVTSGPYATGAVGERVFYQSLGTGTTQARANNVAASRARSLVTRGRQLPLTGIAAYWLRPGHTINVQLPTGETEQQLVQAVSFRPAVGLMDVTTRQPMNVTITTGE